MFVTLEGIDRSGKTTQAALLAEALGPETLLLREPGGTDAGERIRALLKDPATELDPRAELLLFCAARAELCARLVRPALEQGRDVVCDRFVDSTVAYQGAARGLGTDLVERLNEIAIAGCLPDVTVLLEDRSRGRRGPRPAAPGARVAPTASIASRARGSSSSAWSRPPTTTWPRVTLSGSRWSTQRVSVAEVHARVMEAVGRVAARDG